jgi:hypothetical protein
LRCSSCEPRLDEYVETGLDTAQRASITAHLAICGKCRAFAHNLRTINAVFLNARKFEPAPTFTFATMAEIRSFPSPRLRNVSPHAVLVAYLIFAWAVIAALFTFGGSTTRDVLSVLASIPVRSQDVIGGLAHASAHLFGSTTPIVAFVVIMVLLVDGMALVGTAMLSRFLRRRFVAVPSEVRR